MDNRPKSPDRGQTTQLLLYAVAAIIIGTVGIFAYRDFSAPPRWEYKVDAINDEVIFTKLDALGADGWELVTARRVMADDKDGGKVTGYEAIFKRRKRD